MHLNRQFDGFDGLKYILKDQTKNLKAIIGAF